ncbi:MAG: trigger factor [Candidatus Krumholzibacteria bacterium]|jgi:trigger factor|nr:trigger factor [Candidatus Krumholzibacteria bacterium]
MVEQGNPPFRLTVEAPDPCRRVIKVQVPRSDYDRLYRERLTAAVRNHQRPGFRKGKTPRTVVEKELGGRLRAETFEALVPEAYRAAVIEHELYPLTEPALENLVFEDGQDLAFDLAIEVRPAVVADKYEGLRVEERAVEVTTAEVDEVIERLRESRAVYERVDRAAAADDLVKLDMVPLGQDGQPEETRRVTDQSVVVGAERNLPEFNEALPGIVAGQARDVTVTYPDEYPNPELRGRAVTFRLRATAVEAKVLPEIDDAFAAQLQDGQTLLELRGHIREQLLADARQRAAEDLDQQILEQLLAGHEVPVPPSMVETWLRSGLQEMHHHRRQQGLQPDADGDQRYREAARPVAERQIKALFLLDAVRRQERISVAEGEVEARIEAIAAEHGFDLAKYRKFLEQGEEKDRIRQGLLERKTYDFLLSRAEVVPAPAPGAPIDPQAGAERG